MSSISRNVGMNRLLSMFFVSQVLLGCSTPSSFDSSGSELSEVEFRVSNARFDDAYSLLERLAKGGDSLAAAKLAALIDPVNTETSSFNYFWSIPETVKKTNEYDHHITKVALLSAAGGHDWESAVSLYSSAISNEANMVSSASDLVSSRLGYLRNLSSRIVRIHSSVYFEREKESNAHQSNFTKSYQTLPFSSAFYDSWINNSAKQTKYGGCSGLVNQFEASLYKDLSQTPSVVSDRTSNLAVDSYALEEYRRSTSEQCEGDDSPEDRNLRITRLVTKSSVVNSKIVDELYNASKNHNSLLGRGKSTHDSIAAGLSNISSEIMVAESTRPKPKNDGSKGSFFIDMLAVAGSIKAQKDGNVEGMQAMAQLAEQLGTENSGVADAINASSQNQTVLNQKTVNSSTMNSSASCQPVPQACSNAQNQGIQQVKNLQKNVERIQQNFRKEHPDPTALNYVGEWEAFCSAKIAKSVNALCSTQYRRQGNAGCASQYDEQSRRYDVAMSQLANVIKATGGAGTTNADIEGYCR